MTMESYRFILQIVIATEALISTFETTLIIPSMCSRTHPPVSPLFLTQDKLKLYPATTRPNPVQDLDATIYSQMRAFHFLKWNKSAPEALLKECGPCAHSYAMGHRTAVVLPTHVKVQCSAVWCCVVCVVLFVC